MPAASQIPSGGSTVSAELYAGRVEIVKAKILVNEDTLPVATKFEVDVKFNGQYFVNARQRPTGSLPNGILWSSDAQGIRFFGVPQQSGTFEALFEGPYPNNFVGTTTSGNYSVDQCHPTQQPVSPGIQSTAVFGWIVRFIVTTKNASSVNFGTVWRNILGKVNPALTVYREEWGGVSVSTPSAPLNLQAVPGNQSATLSFNSPLSDGGSPITRYEYQTAAGGAWVAGTFSQSQPAGPAAPFGGQITGLTNGQTYTISVRAVNSAGPGQASAVTVTPAASVFATMRLIGNEYGNWNIPNSTAMTRQGAPAGYDWTVTAPVNNANSMVFKFVVGTNNLWDDPNTQVIDNWGENDLPGSSGYFFGDPGGGNIQFLDILGGGSPRPPGTQYRFSFNETTFAWRVVAADSGTGTAPQIQTPLGAWSLTLNQPFSFAVVATGIPAPTFSATGLPAGLSISSAGVVSGTPTGAPGTTIATITATNSAGSDSRQFSLILVGVAPSIEISLGDFPSGQRGFVKSPSNAPGLSGRFDIWHARTYPGFMGPSKAYWEHAIAIPVNYALTGGAQIGSGLEFKTDALADSPWRQYAPPVDVLSTGDYSSPLAITARSGDGIPLGLLPSDPAISPFLYYVTLKSGNVTSNRINVNVSSVITRPYISSVTSQLQQIPNEPISALVINFTQDPIPNVLIDHYEYSTDNGITWRAAQNWASVSPFTINEVSAWGGGPLIAGNTYSVRIRSAFNRGTGGGYGSAVFVSRPSNTVLFPPGTP